MTVRLARRSPRQPPGTWCLAAIADSVSPERTTYVARESPRWRSRVVVDRGATDEVLFVVVVVWAGVHDSFEAAPRYWEQTGHAPQPCAASTFSAIAICADFDARSARDA